MDLLSKSITLHWLLFLPFWGSMMSSYLQTVYSDLLLSSLSRNNTPNWCFALWISLSRFWLIWRMIFYKVPTASVLSNIQFLKLKKLKSNYLLQLMPILNYCSLCLLKTKCLRTAADGSFEENMPSYWPLFWRRKKKCAYLLPFSRQGHS